MQHFDITVLYHLAAHHLILGVTPWTRPLPSQYARTQSQNVGVALDAVCDPGTASVGLGTVDYYDRRTIYQVELDAVIGEAVPGL